MTASTTPGGAPAGQPAGGSASAPTTGGPTTGGPTAGAPPTGAPVAVVGRRRRDRRWESGLRHAFAIAAVCFAIFPIVFVVSAALNPVGTLSSSELVPTQVSGENFTELFRTTPFAHWFWNSILVSGLSSAVSIFVSACAAYAFSRLRFTGRRPGLMFLLLVQMFPTFLAIVALFLMFTEIGNYYPVIGLNSIWGLMLLYLGGALGANTWLMKGFFDTVPKELDEAARVDGASHAKVFFQIIFPLVSPILAVTVLLSFIATINEFIIASLFLTDRHAQTLAVGLYGLVSADRNQNFGLFAAGTLLTAIPTVALFFFLQKYIVGGLAAGAVKG
ncbi:sugar ABC transporter permease [Actinobacteria bacterium YIM 96077]|uniref:Sugar ABC transporter permease n=1 Tax=Phytoactinopolyspora halophila TaxID=1981511 RepID=A0A329QDF0_9ACTN|nr:sugar ABC transporter permease [Phytoactinopolyspora halophila]AYY12456.1 sugar ABC transporter permease [Actinobacteria bacterium YIM 96077]RAW09262.1 sugar ABC transporter permease [Phytoactinopolyspora halophila]